MPRNNFSQSVSQRHLQAIFSQTTVNLDVGVSAVHHKSRKRSFLELDRESEQDTDTFEGRPDCQSEQDVDTFRGRLLGVEAGLIAAVLPKPQVSSCAHYLYRKSDNEVDKYKCCGPEEDLVIFLRFFYNVT
jgi:hypothetical protein